MRVSVCRDAVKARMKDLAISKYGLAELVSARVPQSSVYRFLGGEGITLAHAESLFAALGITLKIPNGGQAQAVPAKR